MPEGTSTAWMRPGSRYSASASWRSRPGTIRRAALAPRGDRRYPAARTGRCGRLAGSSRFRLGGVSRGSGARTQLLGTEELGADHLAIAPDQRANPQNLAGGGEGQPEQLGYRQRADVHADSLPGDVDDGAFDPWGIGRLNHESRLVQIDPHMLARAKVLAVSRH